MIDLFNYLYTFVVGLLTYDDCSVFKCVMGVDDAIMMSAAISAGSNLLGGLFGKKSNDTANKTNLRIARETNALNYKMFQEQNDYNRDMWNMNNAYNSPSAQVQRALDAGLNPYFDAGQLVSASNSSAPTSTSLPTMQTADVRPYDWQTPFNAIGQTATNFMLQRAQIHNLNQQTQESKDLTYQRVKNYIAQNEDLKHSARLKEYAANLASDTFDYQKQLSMYNANIAREQWLQNMAQTKIANVNSKMAELHLEQYPQELRNNLVKQVADILLTKAQTHATYKQAALAAAHTIESQARAEGYRISNEQAHQLVPYIVDQAAYDSYMKRAKYTVYTHFGTEDIGRKTHKTFHGSLGVSKHFGGMAEWNENYDDWMSLPDNWFDGSASK